MVSIYDVPPDKLIGAMAKELEKMPEMAPPSWSIAVKTGVSKIRPPANGDWWYVRSAAVLRSVYKLGPIGVSKLRTKYGSKKDRGYAPDKVFKGSGNILRKILQKLELIGFLKQTQIGVHKGRVLTEKGKSFVDKLAVRLIEPRKAPEPKKAKPEEKKKPEAKEAKEKAVKEEPKEAKEKAVKEEPKEAKEKAVKEEPKEVKEKAVKEEPETKEADQVKATNEAAKEKAEAKPAPKAKKTKKESDSK
jgi:small subunit ribosomal protein S19e